MMQKIKNHLDKLIAALIVLGCLGALAWRLSSVGDQAFSSSSSAKAAINEVEKHIKTNQAPPPPKPDFVSTFAANMGRSEGRLPAERVAWSFYPQPPFVVGFEPSGPPVVTAELSKPAVSLGGVWVGKGTVYVNFGQRDVHCQARALLVWRKPVAEAAWPQQPLAVLIVGADGAATLPPNVTATARGYELKTDDLPPRTAYEYRACSAAVCPAKVASGGTRVGESEVRPPEGAEIAPPDENLKALVEKSLKDKAQGVALLAGGPFFTVFSAATKVELPGDVQLRLTMMEQNEDGNYVRGAFAMRRWIQSREKWVERTERIEIGKDIKGEAQERIDGKVVKYPIDSGVNLVDLKVEMRNPPPVSRMVPKLDPITKKPVQPIEMVEEKVVGQPRRVQFAVVKDKVTGDKSEVIASPDEWWPKGLEIAPKAGEPKAVGPVVAPAPGPGPVAPPPVVLPLAPVVVPAPAPGPGPAPAPGPGPGAMPALPPPPAVAPGRGPAVDLSKPLPPDAPIELKQAYEKARLEAERRQREAEAAGLR